MILILLQHLVHYTEEEIGLGLTFFPGGATTLLGHGTPHFRCFEITDRSTTLGMTSLDDGSARRRDLYLTTHAIHKRQIYVHPAVFEPAVPGSERPQTYTLDRAATDVDLALQNSNIIGVLVRKFVISSDVTITSITILLLLGHSKKILQYKIIV